MTTLVFEDFIAGSANVYGGRRIDTDEIITFAREYDPQPMHIDGEAAQNSFTGGLIASGWYTCSLTMRMFYDNTLVNSSSMGAPGIDSGTWVRPVKPGDTLHICQTVLETRPSRSRPGMGLVNLSFEAFNQNADTVYRQEGWVMFGRRNAGDDILIASKRKASPINSASGDIPALVSASEAIFTAGFEEIDIGNTVKLGQHLFSAEGIVEFAEKFDPQPFHVDSSAAEKTHFGGLCASGWHTASVWMKLIVANHTAATHYARGRGEKPLQLGPSPGFSNMRWLHPVYADDLLTYYSAVTQKRLSASHPGWGIVTTQNWAVNQDGAKVFSFDSSVFWECKNK